MSIALAGRKRIFLLLLVACGAPAPALAAQAPKEQLSVTAAWPRYMDAANSVHLHLNRLAIERLRQREAEVASIRTADEWRERQREVREALREAMGPFPDRTPLRPRVVGVLRKPGYRVEKVVYESVPGMYVPAALFIPEGARGPMPAVVFCSGHTDDAFRAVEYQLPILNLVRKGFVVFAFDPVGQGERLEYFDPAASASRVGRPTAEHSFGGAQGLMSRSSLARTMTWDGIRAIDYLLTRPEVDPSRIGAAGTSGGGAQSAYLGAFDDRVVAVAPANWITSLRRLLESQVRAAQDAEQFLEQQVARGLDHADLLLARAPRATQVLATTRDAFSIQGARETHAELKRAFGALGKPENLELVEDDFEHGYTRPNREAMYAFFQKHLGLPGSPVEESLAPLSAEELRITRTGQVSTSLGGETFSSRTRAAARARAAELERARADPERHLAGVPGLAASLSGFQKPSDSPTVVFAGRYRRDGYSVEKYLLEGDYPVPFLLMRREGSGRRPAILYLHPRGKAAEAAPGGEMERLLRAGYVVLAPDLPGIGETGGGAAAGRTYVPGVSFNLWSTPSLLGRSLPGLRAADVVRLATVLRNRDDVEPAGITAVARGELGPVLLHAAAFEPAISRIALLEPLVSYRALADEEVYAWPLVDVMVSGVLGEYDLPDLAATLAPRALLIAGATDATGRPAPPALVERDLAITRGAYRAAGAESRLEIRPSDPPGSGAILAEWLAR